MSIKLPIRLRLALSFILLAMFLMVLIIIVIEKRQSDTFLAESKKRGVSIAKNLAAVSVNPLLTYNYIVLKQNVEKASKEDDILYIIILDKEKKIAAFSGHDESEGTLLTDDVSVSASKATDVLLQKTIFQDEGSRVLDIAIPVYIGDSSEKWGLVRVGLSLEGMYKDISYTRGVLILLTLATIIVGSLGSFLLSRRITKPLENLVDATVAVANGDLDYKIDISTGDEIEELSKNFNHMTSEVLSNRKELERRFKEISSLKRYNDNILASMTNGLLTLDLDGVVRTINKKGQAILRSEEDEIIGNSLEEIFEKKEGFPHLFRESALNKKTFNKLEVDFKKNGEELTIVLSISQLYDGEGAKIGLLIAFEDMTEMKMLQEMMRRADRLAALGTVAASLAHEIRNPLSTVKTFVQLVPQKMHSDSFIEKFNDLVPKELNRINNILENFLDLARKPRLKFTPMNINSIIEDIVDLYSAKMEHEGISIKVSLHPEAFTISGDYEYLKRAFSNLILNALQAMPNGGNLLIETLPLTLDVGEESEIGVERATKIIFKDTGIGMDSETIKNLFNPFYSTKDKGTGLGLVIVQKIIEEHKGFIEVTSDLKEGSTFTVTLPAIAELQYATRFNV